MSSKIKRRLRKSDHTSQTETPRTENCSSNVCSVAGFESETVSSSSPLKVDKTSARKVRRKKIRSTQDFNQLSSSSFTEDSESSAKIEIKRTKKAKKIYLLPTIKNIEEDSVPDKLRNASLNTEIILGKTSKRKVSRKSNNEDDCSDDVNNKAKQLKSEVNLASHNKSLVKRNKVDSGLQLCNVKIENNLDHKISDKEISKDEYRSEHSISDQKYSGGLSESDTRATSKKKLQKKNKSGGTKSRDESIRSNMNNNCNLSNEETDINNPSLNKSTIKLLGQTSPYQDQRCVSSKLGPKQTNVNDIQQNKILHDSFVFLSPKERNERKQLIVIERESDGSNLKSVGGMFNNTTNNQEGLMTNLREKKIKFSTRSKSLANNLNTSPAQSARKKKRSMDTFHLVANESFNKNCSGNTIILSDLELMNTIDYDDDVFDKTPITEKINKSQEIPQLQKHTITECVLNNSSTKREARKSVRFISPKEKRNIQRNTFDLEKSVTDLTLLKSAEIKSKLNDVSPKYKNNGSIYDKTSPSFCLSQNISTKDGRFDPLKVNILQSKSFFDKSLNENATQNEVSDVTLSEEWAILKSRSKNSTVRLSSKCGRSSTQLKNDVHKGTSLGFAVSKKISQRNSKNKTSPKVSNSGIGVENFQMESTPFIGEKSVIDLTTPEASPFPAYLEELSNKNPSVMKLIRQSTFTKTVEIPESELKELTPSKLDSTGTVIKDQNKSVFDQNYDSPFDISNVRAVDSSKVNKRKRWNKSQTSISFLDFTNLAEISAPWNELSNANDSSKYLDLSKNKAICQSPIVNRTVSIIRTPPSKTSTPCPISSKNVLLKRALIRDKRNVLINKSKNLSEVVEKPVAKPIRSKMPNFALIHQRAYDKMENLKEMSERKAVRAKLLLSGYKPTDQNTLKSPSKSKKFLQFSPSKSKTAPSISENRNNTGSSNKSNILITKIKNISPSKSNIKLANKENKLAPLEKKKLIKSSQIPRPEPRPKVHNNIITEKKGFTRYGFKVGSNSAISATKEEQKKAISTKTKIMKNTLEERRNAIQGVRSNRRFELLMSMRNK